MKAVVWRGNQHVEIDDLPDPMIREPTDAIVRVTATALCGSDLHLYAGLIPGIRPGDVREEEWPSRWGRVR
jgi:threonine dehydrogenase-like Zn-dependent dehydrogenase